MYRLDWPVVNSDTLLIGADHAMTGVTCRKLSLVVSDFDQHHTEAYSEKRAVPNPLHCYVVDMSNSRSSSTDASCRIRSDSQTTVCR